MTNRTIRVVGEEAEFDKQVAAAEDDLKKAGMSIFASNNFCVSHNGELVFVCILMYREGFKKA